MDSTRENDGAEKGNSIEKGIWMESNRKSSGGADNGNDDSQDRNLKEAHTIS